MGSEESHQPGVLVKAIWADDNTPATDVGIVASVPHDPTLENLPPRMRRDALRFRSSRTTKRTDHRGEAWFGDLRPGTWQLTTEHGIQQTVHVVESRQHEALLVLPPLDLIRGIVVDDLGEPVPQAKLWISGDPTGTFGSFRGHSRRR